MTLSLAFQLQYMTNRLKIHHMILLIYLIVLPIPAGMASLLFSGLHIGYMIENDVYTVGRQHPRLFRYALLTAKTRGAQAALLCITLLIIHPTIAPHPFWWVIRTLLVVTSGMLHIEHHRLRKPRCWRNRRKVL
jgi:hypothetical protein